MRWGLLKTPWLWDDTDWVSVSYGQLLQDLAVWKRLQLKSTLPFSCRIVYPIASTSANVRDQVKVGQRAFGRI